MTTVRYSPELEPVTSSRLSPSMTNKGTPPKTDRIQGGATSVRHRHSKVIDAGATISLGSEPSSSNGNDDLSSNDPDHRSDDDGDSSEDGQGCSSTSKHSQ